MAIAFDAVSHSGNTTAASWTLSHTVTGTNPGLAVWISSASTTDNLTGVTYNGVAMTRKIAVNQGGSAAPSNYYYIYYIKAPATGTHNIVASFSPNTAGDMGGVSYTGVGDVENTGTNANTSTDIGVTVTTVNANSIIAGYCEATGSGGGSGLSAGANTTMRDNFSVFNIDSWGDSVGTAFSPGANTINFHRVFGNSAYNDAMAISIAPFVAASANSGFFFAAAG